VAAATFRVDSESVPHAFDSIIQQYIYKHGEEKGEEIRNGCINTVLACDSDSRLSKIIQVKHGTQHIIAGT
jgi:metal-responsive CopG/Arc/MetJ family transcriptional regulator